MGFFEEVFLPVRSLVFQYTQFLQFIGVDKGALRVDGEVDFRVGYDLLYQRQRQLGFFYADVGLGGSLFIGLDDLRRLSQGVIERLVGLGVFVVEFLGGVEHVERRLTAQHVIGTEHLVHVRVLQFLILERRAGEVGVDFRTTSDQGSGRVRVRDTHRDVVELLEVGITELLGGFDLQGAGLEAHASGRNGDAVLVAEVFKRLDLRPVAQQVVGHRAQRGDGLDVLLALGAVPQHQHRRDACRYHVQCASQQCFVHGGGARNAVPVDLDVQPFCLAVFLDQFLILHHVKDQVTNAELLGNADFAFGLRAATEQCACHTERRSQYSECRAFERSNHGDPLVGTKKKKRRASIHQRCMPQRFTVRRSMLLNNRFSTSRPIRITATRPANTLSVYSSLRFWKMYQPRPPLPDEAPNTSSAAIKVRQANAQPIFRPARIDGSAAGIRMNQTTLAPFEPKLRPAMRWVSETPRKPA